MGPVAKIAMVVVFVGVTYGASQKHQHEDTDVYIINGQPAEIWEFPYQVSIQYLDIHNCGGSIISPKYILTAAHCFDGVTEEETSVRVGSSTILSGGILVNVKQIYSNPKFEYIAFDYDIAVLELEEELAYTENIQPILLPESNTSVPDDSIGTLTGWGSTEEYSTDMSTQLMTVNLPIISNEECVEIYPTDGISERQLCAGLKEGGKDGCLGDSGGPLVVDGVQVGIVSWGKKCAEPNKPGVYTNVAEPEMRSFIKQIAGV